MTTMAAVVARARKLAPVLICLSGVIPGCQSTHSAAGPPSLSSDYGRNGPYQQGSDSGVRQASAVEPAIPRDLPGEELKFDDERQDGFQWSDLAPETIWHNIKVATGNGPNEGVARALFGEGLELYRQKRFKAAAKRFKAAAGRWPDSPLEEDALFLAGESCFFSDQYPEAKDAYGRLLEKHKHTRHLDRVSSRMFAIGRYWDGLHAVDPGWPFSIDLLDPTRPWIDPLGHALKAYESVRMNDPTGPLADDSLMATANALFTRGRYEEAANYYDVLRKHHAKSEHLLDAYLLEMKSRLKTYQGPMYDGTPLVKAGELADQLLTQFPDQISEHRNLVVQNKNRIVEQMAQRDWEVAQYFENRKLYGAARFYYQAIFDDFPHTVVAGQARARLEQIRDLPAEPPDRFKWVTGLFGTTNGEQQQQAADFGGSWLR
jgi:outer membrane protein assembly factor BamD (BamD/ComL family)